MRLVVFLVGSFSQHLLCALIYQYRSEPEAISARTIITTITRLVAWLLLINYSTLGCGYY